MWNFVGNTHFKAGNISLAEPYHRKALEVEPQFAPAHVSLVRILKREGRFEEAIVVRNRFFIALLFSIVCVEDSTDTLKCNNIA